MDSTRKFFRVPTECQEVPRTRVTHDVPVSVTTEDTGAVVLSNLMDVVSAIELPDECIGHTCTVTIDGLVLFSFAYGGGAHALPVPLNCRGALYNLFKLTVDGIETVRVRVLGWCITDESYNQLLSLRYVTKSGNILKSVDHTIVTTGQLHDNYLLSYE
jgi:hypothetical protein